MRMIVRGLFAVAVAVAMASTSFADGPACNDGGCGWNPLVKRLFSFNRCRPCAAPTPPPFAGPKYQPGTVVFPNHPFARSPRDFFMVD